MVAPFAGCNESSISKKNQALNEKKEGCEGVGGETGKKRSNKKEKEPDKFDKR
jgi:hypothetical protein